jgi:hypothetical protein
VQAIVTLRSGKRVDNKVVNPEEDHAEEEEKNHFLQTYSTFHFLFPRFSATN